MAGIRDEARGRPLRVGLFLPIDEAALPDGPPRWADLAAMAAPAEGLGFDFALAAGPPALPLPRRAADRHVGGLVVAGRPGGHRRGGSSSARSSPAPASATRRCWPRWPTPSTRSAAVG